MSASPPSSRLSVVHGDQLAPALLTLHVPHPVHPSAVPISEPARAVHPCGAVSLHCPTALGVHTSLLPTPALCHVHQGGASSAQGCCYLLPSWRRKGCPCVSLGRKPTRPCSEGKQQTGGCTGGPKGSTQKSRAGRRWVALLSFISLAAGNTHRATHGKETVYTECPYKYFQCTFYTQVTETFHSSVQSLWVPALSCRLGPKPKGDAHLLSPLAQPETSPAWAAAGASGDALMETLCMALGLEGQ